MKQVVLFDVDGVLIRGYSTRADLRRCWDEHLERDFGITQAAFRDQFIFGPFAKEVLVGKKGLEEALAETLPKMGRPDISPQDIANYWLENDSVLNDDLLEKIRALKDSGQVRLFIATNQDHSRADHLMTRLGLDAYFEDIFHSARIGATKPNPAYFEGVSEILALPDGETPIFFDDCPRTVAAARKHGWQAHEFVHAEDVMKDDFIRELLKTA